MNQLNEEALRTKLCIAQNLSNPYRIPPQFQKNLFTSRIFDSQAKIFKPNQYEISPIHQQILRAQLSFLRNGRQILPTFRNFHNHPIFSQKDDKLAHEKQNFDSQEPKSFVKELINSQPTRNYNEVGLTATHKVSLPNEKCEQKANTQKPSNSRRTKNYWLPKEDMLLMELVGCYGTRWTQIAAFLEGRTGKQVRDRYLNYLKPSIKQKGWTVEEEGLLAKLYETFGNRWSKIAEYIPGRTEIQVKNKFYSGLKKGRYAQKHKTNESEEDPEKPLKFVQTDPHFENLLIQGLKDESSSKLSISNEQAIKSEAFATCDTLPQYISRQYGNSGQNSHYCTNLSEKYKNFVNKGIPQLENCILEQNVDKNQEELGNPYKKVKHQTISQNPEEEIRIRAT